jgi:hypothetical protein
MFQNRRTLLYCHSKQRDKCPTVWASPPTSRRRPPHTPATATVRSRPARCGPRRTGTCSRAPPPAKGTRRPVRPGRPIVIGWRQAGEFFCCLGWGRACAAHVARPPPAVPTCPLVVTQAGVAAAVYTYSYTVHHQMKSTGYNNTSKN